MREILFKAKRVKNGEWIEGSLIDLDIDSGYCYIVPPYKGASTLVSIEAVTREEKYNCTREQLRSAEKLICRRLECLLERNYKNKR